MPARVVLVGLLMALLCAHPAVSGAHDFYLRQVNVVDVAARTVQPTDIAVVQGRITAWPDTLPKGADIRDMHAHWLVPGLIDLHVHISGNPFPDGSSERLTPQQTARRMLYAGVTAMLDLAGDPDELFAARQQQREHPTDEADLFAAGVGFGNWNLPSAADAPAVVRDYVRARKPDVVKFIYDKTTLDGAVFRATMQALQDMGVKTVVHIGTWEHAADAIRAGATAVTHFHDDAVIPDAVVQLWAHSKTVSIPTLAVQTDMRVFADTPSLLTNPLLAALVPSAGLASYRTPANFSTKAEGTMTWQHDFRVNDQQTLTKLRVAGVPMLAGSDTNNLGTFQGFSLHSELALLRAGGLPAWDTLAAATTRAAQFLNRPLGTQRGDVAEFVLLTANPVDDISNTQKIAGVVHHGAWVDRAALRDRWQHGF